MSSLDQVLNQNREFIVAVKVIESPLEKEQYKDGTAQKLLFAGEPINALVDTGANTTSISQRYADYLGLVSTGEIITVTAGGERRTDLFSIDIAIPVTQTVLKPFTAEDGSQQVKSVVIGEEHWAHIELEIISFNVKGNHGFDILLGMDILSQMHITMFKGQIIMSF